MRDVENGGYASDLLLARTEDLQERDAGLASEIVFGCLRRQAQLDFLIGHFSGRPALRLDPEVRIALRMGIYQLRYLDRVPAHAAVAESVNLVKQARKRSATGLVNAILRKVHRNPIEFPDRATRLSQPAWLLEAWDRQFGPAISQSIAEAFLSEPETYVRNPPDRPGLQVEATEVPGAFRVLSGDIAGLRTQDIGSQSIVPLLNLEPGLTFLDLCAAPGNKTAQAMESGAMVIACDVHQRRLTHVPGEHRVVLDAALALPFKDRFDRILADVPCSGTGTLARNPEIRWRLQPAAIERLQDTQAGILRQALTVLAPGGRLVYSTCSLETPENESVVERVLSESGAHLVEMVRRTPGLQPGDGFFAAVITSG